MKCQFFNESTQQYESAGLTPAPPPNGQPDGFLYCDSTHLTEFGGISFPASAEELLAELTPTFSLFTADEALAILSNFDFAANPTISITLFTILGLDFFTLFLLGGWRGWRRYTYRKREGRLHENERLVAELRETQKGILKDQAEKGSPLAKLKIARLEGRLVQAMEHDVQGLADSARSLAIRRARTAQRKLTAAKSFIRAANGATSAPPLAANAGRETFLLRLKEAASDPPNTRKWLPPVALEFSKAGHLLVMAPHNSTGPPEERTIQERLVGSSRFSKATQPPQPPPPQPSPASGRSACRALTTCSQDRQSQGASPAVFSQSAVQRAFERRQGLITPPVCRLNQTLDPDDARSAKGSAFSSAFRSRFGIGGSSSPPPSPPSLPPPAFDSPAHCRTHQRLAAAARVLPNQIPPSIVAARREASQSCNRTCQPTGRGVPASTPLPAAYGRIGTASAMMAALARARSEIDAEQSGTPNLVTPASRVTMSPSMLQLSCSTDRVQPPTNRSKLTSSRPTPMRVNEMRDRQRQRVRRRLGDELNVRSLPSQQPTEGAMASPSASGAALGMEHICQIRSPEVAIETYRNRRTIRASQRASRASEAEPTGEDGRHSSATDGDDVAGDGEDAVHADEGEPTGSAVENGTSNVGQHRKKRSLHSLLQRAVNEDGDLEAKRTERYWGTQAAMNDRLNALRDVKWQDVRSVQSPVTNETRLSQRACSPYARSGGDSLSACPVLVRVLQVSDKLGIFSRNLVSGARSDSTIISFIAPEEDEEALTEMQVVQIFWSVLTVDLAINCVQTERPDATAPDGPPEPEPVISIGIIVDGLVAAVLTVIVVMILRAIFRWGNKRRYQPGPSTMVRIVRSLLKLLIRGPCQLLYRDWLRVRRGRGNGLKKKTSNIRKRASHSAAAKTPADGPRAVRRGWDIGLKRRGAARKRNAAADAPSGGSCNDDVAAQRVSNLPPMLMPPACTPPPSPPMHSIVVGASRCPDSLAPPRPSPASTVLSVLPPPRRTSAPSAPLPGRQRAAGADGQRGVGMSTPQRSRSLVHARGALGAWKSLPLQLATPNAASTASRIKALNIRALVATPTNDPIRLKRKELHLRSTCMFMARSGLAWTVNIAVLLGLCVLILIYAGLFGDKEVKTLIKTWALAIGMACGVSTRHALALSLRESAS